MKIDDQLFEYRWERPFWSGYKVLSINEQGVVAEWNARNPRAVREGDFIVSVNGETSFNAMYDELQRCIRISVDIMPLAEANRKNPLYMPDDIEPQLRGVKTARQ